MNKREEKKYWKNFFNRIDEQGEKPKPWKKTKIK